MTPTLHIIGAGLAGLSAGVHAQNKGLKVKLYEASPVSGGRIRSVTTDPFDRPIDNGTHLIVQAYKDSFEYLHMIGARDRLVPFSKPFSFVEPATGLSWNVSVQNLAKSLYRGAVPGFGLRDLLGSFRFFVAPQQRSVSEALNNPVAIQRFWEPMLLGIFNDELANIRLPSLRACLWEILKAGPNGFQPYFAAKTLADCFVEPAEKLISIDHGQALKSIGVAQDQVNALHFRNHTVALAPEDQVILALPQNACAKIEALGFVNSVDQNPITNIHFALPEPRAHRFLGLIGTLSQWVMTSENIASVTISNYKPGDHDTCIKRVWAEIAGPLGFTGLDCPPAKLICEKQATFAQTHHVRPSSKTPFKNLHLAGDWTDTGLPATIEGAIRSGKTAAVRVAQRLTS